MAKQRRWLKQEPPTFCVRGAPLTGQALLGNCVYGAGFLRLPLLELQNHLGALHRFRFQFDVFFFLPNPPLFRRSLSATTAKSWWPRATFGLLGSGRTKPGVALVFGRDFGSCPSQSENQLSQCCGKDTKVSQHDDPSPLFGRYTKPPESDTPLSTSQRNKQQTTQHNLKQQY